MLCFRRKNGLPIVHFGNAEEIIMIRFKVGKFPRASLQVTLGIFFENGAGTGLERCISGDGVQLLELTFQLLQKDHGSVASCQFPCVVETGPTVIIVRTIDTFALGPGLTSYTFTLSLS